MRAATSRRRRRTWPRSRRRASICSRWSDYAFGSVQFSRGCPFTCEFCDIIVIFGRRPRLKTSSQIIVELEALRARNLSISSSSSMTISSATRRRSRRSCATSSPGRRRNGYPLMFVTEASIDLADDEELMQLMVEANIARRLRRHREHQRGIAERDEEAAEPQARRHA